MNYKKAIEKQITILEMKQDNVASTSTINSCEIARTIAVLAETASRLPQQFEPEQK